LSRKAYVHSVSAGLWHQLWWSRWVCWAFPVQMWQ